jgi:3-oxoacyl-[acyl-carrier protein] reductase
MSTEGPLSGRVAIVTGGSRGIGKACALLLAQRGARVVVNYTQQAQAAEEVAAAITSAGGQAVVRQFDVSQSSQVSAAIKALAGELGRIDILVNNAGVAVDGLAMRIKDDDWHRALSINLSGSFYLCREAMRYLLKSPAGRIINLTSVVGEMGSTGQVAYTAAKSGILGLTRTLARELGKRGVTVNAVSPGYIDTDMTRASVSEENQKKLAEMIPLGRVGTAADVAETVGFLASDAAAYITGQVLRVNGGLYM